MSKELVTQEKKEVALLEPQLVRAIEGEINQMIIARKLQLPKNYSPDNALKAAWLAIQEVEDINHKPALEVCTRRSIANALLDMLLLGLNPAKNQCYFIVYANKLQCQRSYYGDMVAAKRLTNAKDIVAEVVYDGDELLYQINEKGQKVFKGHTLMAGRESKPIIGAYVNIYFQDGSTYFDYLPMEHIRARWKQGKLYKENDKGQPIGNSFHVKFPEMAAKRTMIRKACTFFINQSDDSNLEVIRAFERTEDKEAIDTDIIPAGEDEEETKPEWSPVLTHEDYLARINRMLRLHRELANNSKLGEEAIAKELMSWSEFKGREFTLSEFVRDEEAFERWEVLISEKLIAKAQARTEKAEKAKGELFGE
jgi:recombination protein RecT